MQAWWIAALGAGTAVAATMGAATLVLRRWAGDLERSRRRLEAVGAVATARGGEGS